MRNMDRYDEPRLLAGRTYLIQRRTQSTGERAGIIDSPEVHEEKPWLLRQHVTVQRRNFDSVFAQRLDDWIHFARDQHKITRDGGAVLPYRLEINGCCDAHRRRNLRPIIIYFLRTWHGKLQNATVHLAALTKHLLNLLLIDLEKSAGSSLGRRTWGFRERQGIMNGPRHFRCLALARDM